MSTKIQYQVVTEEGTKVVSTLKEVSTLLGERVTKARINAGELTGVVTELLGNESMDDIDEGVARVYDSEGQYTGIKLVNPLGDSDNNNNNNNNNEGEDSMELAATDISSTEEEALINSILEGDSNIDEYDDEYGDDTEEDSEEGIEDEPTDEEEVPTDEDSEEDSDEEVPNDEPTKEEDSAKPTTGKSNLEELKAKLKEINARKAKESTGSTTTKKGGKKSPTIQFTGEYPEVGAFEEKKQLQKFYKQLTDEQLEDWLELEGLTYNPSDNEPINRMRKCMAILNLHFPKETKGSSKKKSKYADYTTEQLLEMALDNDVEVKEAKGDERILRMYTIIALRDAGLLE